MPYSSVRTCGTGIVKMHWAPDNIKVYFYTKIRVFVHPQQQLGPTYRGITLKVLPMYRAVHQIMKMLLSLDLKVIRGHHLFM